MKLIKSFLALVLVTGCASTSELKQVQKDLTSAKQETTRLKERLALTSYRSEEQICKFNALICLLASSDLKDTCLLLNKQCIAAAEEDFKKETGHTPPSTEN